MRPLPDPRDKDSFRNLKVCVLQPDYSTSDVDYQYNDPPRDLAPLIPEAEFVHVFLNKLTTYQQLRKLKEEQFDIYVNLCEGYLDWSVPSIDVITSLDLLGLPYTGPTTTLYDPSKPIMKYLAYCEGIPSPAYMLIESAADLDLIPGDLRFPLFVKPAKAGDSLGIDKTNRAENASQAITKARALLPEYGQVLVEEYVEGREFSVLVCANPDGKTCTSFLPVEYQFPDGYSFKTYALKTSELHPLANVPVTDQQLAARLQAMAERVFMGFNGRGYARTDFRMNAEGDLFFLEINFTCSVFYSRGYEGTADYILQYDGCGQRGFLERIIAEGMARHQRKEKCYAIRGNAISGYGMYAKEDLAENALVFTGEEKAQRIVTKEYVEAHWDEWAKNSFRQYAYPIGSSVYILWDEKPEEWAPQNHSCDANCGYIGLNVYTLRPVRKGEELTLDYALFLDETMEPFDCSCGAANCRGRITGTRRVP